MFGSLGFVCLGVLGDFLFVLLFWWGRVGLVLIFGVWVFGGVVGFFSEGCLVLAVFVVVGGGFGVMGVLGRGG